MDGLGLYGLIGPSLLVLRLGLLHPKLIIDVE